jgi:hypothetical protein
MTGRSESTSFIWGSGGDIPVDSTHVKVHSSVKAIEQSTIKRCRQLMIVILNDGLEEIGWDAFNGCSSLQHIAIPNAVNVIKHGAFFECSG